VFATRHHSLHMYLQSPSDVHQSLARLTQDNRHIWRWGSVEMQKVLRRCVQRCSHLRVGRSNRQRTTGQFTSKVPRRRLRKSSGTRRLFCTDCNGSQLRAEDGPALNKIIILAECALTLCRRNGNRHNSKCDWRSAHISKRVMPTSIVVEPLEICVPASVRALRPPLRSDLQRNPKPPNRRPSHTPRGFDIPTLRRTQWKAGRPQATGFSLCWSHPRDESYKKIRALVTIRHQFERRRAYTSAR
jgi:hypothetical protein